MIKLFRNIRQSLLMENKTSRYLKYAIGEIVLVVIGILIALQINNWNENRKAELAQKELLANFLNDLKADLELLQFFKETLSDYIKTHEQVYRASKGLIKPEDVKDPVKIRGSIRYHSIVLSNDPDIATKIANVEIRDKVLDYYRRLSGLNNSYKQFHDVILGVMRPFLAKYNLLNPDSLFEELNENVYPLNLDQFYEVIKTKEFGQVLFEANKKATETLSIFKELIIENEALAKTIEDYE